MAEQQIDSQDIFAIEYWEDVFLEMKSTFLKLKNRKSVLVGVHATHIFHKTPLQSWFFKIYMIKVILIISI